MPALADPDPDPGEREALLAREADVPRRPGLDAATRDITASEHDRGFWDAVRRHPYAVLWSALFCLAVVMAGFDAQLVTSLYALPAFQRRFGYEHDGHYIISAGWQTALGMGSPVGQVLGALACDYPLESLGRRATLALCCGWSIVFVFVQYSAASIEMLCVGEVLGGLVYGFYVVVAPTYASEVCPLALRGVLAAAVNLAFVVGQFIAQASCAAFETRLDEGAYKTLFAIQWVWPAVLLVGLAFAPESPYWLVRKGRDADARAALARLASPKHQLDVDRHLAMIQHTDLLERELTESTSYVDCFSDANLLRTEISVMVYLIQVVAGNPLIGYANFFFEMAGLDSADAFMMGIVNVVLGFVGTCVSWVLINYFGRRTIYNSGLAWMTLILFVIGFLDFGRSQSAVVWVQASLLDLWTLVYQMSVGPICFVIISEISATRLRARTIAVATAVQALASVVFTFALPYMLTSDQADWRGKTGFFFGAISIACYVWCWLRLPESRGRTFEELDILFSRGVPPRQFASYDLLADDQPQDSDQ